MSCKSRRDVVEAQITRKGFKARVGKRIIGRRESSGCSAKRSYNLSEKASSGWHQSCTGRKSDRKEVWWTVGELARPWGPPLIQLNDNESNRRFAGFTVPASPAPPIDTRTTSLNAPLFCKYQGTYLLGPEAPDFVSRDPPEQIFHLELAGISITVMHRPAPPVRRTMIPL